MLTGLYRYPAHPHRHRHWPIGYPTRELYRPWLRDEYDFRCVYCLQRETWLPGGEDAIRKGYLPVLIDPAEGLRYDNLVYACTSCAFAKGNLVMPDPLVVLTEDAVTCDSDGTLQCGTIAAAHLVELLDLNSPAHREFRRTVLFAERLAVRFDPDIARRLREWPDDLPDLAAAYPPLQNARPAGVASSYFARRNNGALPETI